MSSKKNPNLCERDGCREPYTKVIHVVNVRTHNYWSMRVCNTHLEPYRHLSPINYTAQIQRREATP